MHANIHGNPVLKFHGNGPVFFGLEIEIHRTAPALTQDTPLSWFKLEGSCCSGAELVTHPMSWAYWLREGRKVIGDLLTAQAAKGAYTNGSVGNHIHVTKCAWATGLHLYRTLEFMAVNHDFMFLLSGRDSRAAMDLWAQIPRDLKRTRLFNARQGFKECGGNGRDYALATWSHFGKTNEFRLFQSSVDINVISKNMETVHSLISFTGQAGLKELTSELYCRFVTRNRSEYPHLYDYLVAKDQITRRVVPAQHRKVAAACA